MLRFAIRVLALAACGGLLGACGGSSSQNTSPVDTQTAISLTAAAAPEETATQQFARSAAIFSRVDSVTSSTLYGETDHASFPASNLAADCSGTICTYTNPNTGISITRPIILTEVESAVDTVRAVLTKNGITLFEGHGGTSGPNYRVYGAWMDHGAFGVETKGQSTWELADGTDVTFTGRDAVAGGDLTGSRPTASATWHGVMVGTPSRGGHRDNILQGDARLTYDLETKNLNAVFDNIVNLDRRADHTATTVQFDNVRVAADGSYSAGGVGNSIQGGFAGSNHEETGGTFEQRGIIGAFGAKRLAN